MLYAKVVQEVSGNILADESILSSQEKELLSDLLRRVQAQSSGETPQAAITRAVGEVISERMSRVLGTSVVQHLLSHKRESSEFVYRTDGPKPPGPVPPSPPGPHMPQPTGPKPPGPVPPSPPGPGFMPGDGPKPPGPVPPSPPGPHAAARVSMETSARAEFLPAHCVLLPEFLSPQELQGIIQYAVRHENDFRVSEVVSPGVPGGSIDFESRRSRVLLDLGEHRDVLLDRIKLAWPLILKQLGHPEFPISSNEVQVTASNDGDFFRWHSDNSQPEIRAREITFVYFFHREPKQFSGGELRIYDSLWKDGSYVPGSRYRTIVPEQNQLVLFASSLAHEISRVNCPTGAFADSRFTVNGWFHR